MNIDEILENFLREVDSTYHDKVRLSKTYKKAKADILKWARGQLPKKKELDDCGIVKEVCYGYNQAQKGFNACVNEMEKKFK